SEARGTRSASPRDTRERTPKWSAAMLRSRASSAARSCSTNVALRAPRLKASRPNAPTPAKRSSTRAPSTRAPRMAKIDSRKLSRAGRVVRPFGPTRGKPRADPAMMRMRASRGKGPRENGRRDSLRASVRSAPRHLERQVGAGALSALVIDGLDLEEIGPAFEVARKRAFRPELDRCTRGVASRFRTIEEIAEVPRLALRIEEPQARRERAAV